MRWAERRPARRGVWLLIALLHLALIPLLSPPRMARPEAPSPGLVTVRLLPVPAPQVAAPRAVPRATARPAAQARPAEALSPPPIAAPEVSAAAEPPPPQAAASSPQPLLINTEATRRAVRMMAREPLLSERTQAATGLEPRETSQARLGREMQQAGRGDCNKGEFIGGGLGLLSLPFYLVAEAAGKCAK